MSKFFESQFHDAVSALVYSLAKLTVRNRIDRSLTRLIMI